MNADEFAVWCGAQHFDNWKVAAEALGLPYRTLLRMKDGSKRNCARVVLACIRFEYCQNNQTRGQAADHYAAVGRRIARLLKRPLNSCDADLATALILGLSAVVGLDRGAFAEMVLLSQASDIISRAEKWRLITAALPDRGQSARDFLLNQLAASHRAHAK